NRALVAGVAATFIVLMAGAVTSTMLAIRAQRAETLATDRMTRALNAEARARAQRRDAEEARAQAESRRAEADSQRAFAEQERSIAATQRKAAVKSSEEGLFGTAKASPIKPFPEAILWSAVPWAVHAGKVSLD